MDVEAQAEFWKSGSDEDMAAARCLLEGGHWRQALFLAHLSLEKLLKAHVARHTKDVPPRTHDLVRLAELAGLRLDKARKAALGEFGVYQLEGRYPGSAPAAVDAALARQEMERAEELLRWLTEQS
jgi:HEPN domain-containing protein